MFPVKGSSRLPDLARGELTTRTRLMFWVLPQATVADTLAYVDSLPEPGSVADDGGGLGIWGLKLGMDGGVEGGRPGPNRSGTACRRGLWLTFLSPFGLSASTPTPT